MLFSYRHLLTIVLLLVIQTPATKADLILNGSFESPSAAGSGDLIEVYAGHEPAGFQWTVNSGSVEILRQGYNNFSGPAFDGTQVIDLDGLSAGSLSQTFATTPGETYTLSFAYANNFTYSLASATVDVLDSVSSNVLFTENIAHNTSQSNDYHWAQSGLLNFTAIGNNTTLSFISDDPATNEAGIFLDAVSVNPATVPEPGSLTLFLVGVACVAMRCSWRHKGRNSLNDAATGLDIGQQR